MMEFCTPFIERGGCDTVYVMPNLQPPIRYASDALLYHKKLSKLAPNVKFMMTLFLHPGLDERSIAEAAQSEHIYGVTS